jgi:Mg-chelatase subunit ChlD
MVSTQSTNRRAARFRKGAMLVFVAVTIVILFVAAALAVDIAHMHMIRAELRTATDAAARAGAESLGRTERTDLAIQAAMNIASQNVVAGKPLQLAPGDIVFGRNTPNTSGGFNFAANQQPFNAVQIVGRRQKGSPSGEVPLVFGPLFGVMKFEPVQVAVAGRLDRDIALVLDVSGSMAEFGRFDALRNGLNVFLNELAISKQEEFVSLTVYNHIATKLHPMTPDLAAIKKAFANTSPAGFTAIGLGLEKGIDSLLNDPNSRKLVNRSVILMTDGNHNTGINPLQVVPKAKAANIVVHTITFSTAANQTLMKNVASQTGGIHLHADTNEQLIKIFREIALASPVTLTQ